MEGEESKAVRWGKKKNGDRKGKHTQSISVMIIMIVLIGFVGVIIGQMKGRE